MQKEGRFTQLNLFYFQDNYPASAGTATVMQRLEIMKKLSAKYSLLTVLKLDMSFNK